MGQEPSFNFHTIPAESHQCRRGHRLRTVVCAPTAGGTTREPQRLDLFCVQTPCPNHQAILSPISPSGLGKQKPQRSHQTRKRETSLCHILSHPGLLVPRFYLRFPGFTHLSLGCGVRPLPQEDLGALAICFLVHKPAWDGSFLSSDPSLCFSGYHLCHDP